MTLPPPPRRQASPAPVLHAVLLVFVASAFLLPSEPAYSLVFYIGLALCALRHREWLAGSAALRNPGPILALLLIVWSGLTLLWGHDDGHRTRHFAVDTLMTGAFVVLMLRAWSSEPASMRLLGTMLIWCGAANAVLSVALGQILKQDGPRLHGWGATSHPILGASVMAVAYLAALCRIVSERPGRAANGVAAACMVAFILLTESRGPMLAAGAATLFVCAAGRWRWRALGMLAALAVVWVLLPASLRHHQTAVLVSRGASHRFEIWHRTLEMIARHPVLGNGLAANLDLPDMTFPHDLYLSVLFYSGVIGFVLFVALCGVVTARLWRGWRAGQGAWLWLAALWINALLAGLTDLGQITKGPGPLWLILWLPVGLILATLPGVSTAGALIPRAAASHPPLPARP